MQTNETIIAQTKTWITDVVIGCNFCPFAAREVKLDTILYEVFVDLDRNDAMQALLKIFIAMDNDKNVETAFLILPNGLDDFTTYLDVVNDSEDFLLNEKYEGIYQLASFHPQYLFAGSTEKDAENYTNRSPYAMLHVLREASLSKAIDNHPNVDSIPQTNIDFARAKGLDWMRKVASPNPSEGKPPLTPESGELS
jgi:uncharacterized protein